MRTILKMLLVATICMAFSTQAIASTADEPLDSNIVSKKIKQLNYKVKRLTNLKRKVANKPYQLRNVNNQLKAATIELKKYNLQADSIKKGDYLQAGSIKKGEYPDNKVERVIDKRIVKSMGLKLKDFKNNVESMRVIISTIATEAGLNPTEIMVQTGQSMGIDVTGLIDIDSAICDCGNCSGGESSCTTKDGDALPCSLYPEECKPKSNMTAGVDIENLVNVKNVFNSTLQQQEFMINFMNLVMTNIQNQ